MEAYYQQWWKSKKMEAGYWKGEEEFKTKVAEDDELVTADNNGVHITRKEFDKALNVWRKLGFSIWRRITQWTTESTK